MRRRVIPDLIRDPVKLFDTPSACGGVVHFENTMYCLIYNPEQGGYLEFKNPSSIIKTSDVAQVMDCLSEVETAIELKNYVAGFISYEAASAFDEAFITHEVGAIPLLAFGVYKSVIQIDQEEVKNPASFESWKSTVQEDLYSSSIAKIKNYIAEGDTYQVNHTFKLTSKFKGDPKQLFFGSRTD